MEDTPAHVKKLQLEIWLSKTPEERITLALKMNDELNAFWNEGKKNMAANKAQSDMQPPAAI
ncbi:MAG: hypothetical protein ABIN13_04140 [Mucilaginibacter sp.]